MLIKQDRRKWKEINWCSSSNHNVNVYKGMIHYLRIRALYFRFNWRLCIWETEREKGRNTREISTVKRPWGPCIHTYICLFFTTNEFSLLNGPPLASYNLDNQMWWLLCQIRVDFNYNNQGRNSRSDRCDRLQHPRGRTKNFPTVTSMPKCIYNPITVVGFWQCVPFRWTTLRGKYCQHPIAVM